MHRREWRGERPPTPLRTWLAAEQATWVGLWKVEAIESNGRVLLIEQMTGFEVRVVDLDLAEQARVGTIHLARIVQYDDRMLVSARFGETVDAARCEAFIKAAADKLRDGEALGEGERPLPALLQKGYTRYLFFHQMLDALAPTH